MAEPSKLPTGYYPWGGGFIIATMCFCGDNQAIGNDGLFVPHTNRRTGEPCPPPGNFMERAKEAGSDPHI